LALRKTVKTQDVVVQPRPAKAQKPSPLSGLKNGELRTDLCRISLHLKDDSRHRQIGMIDNRGGSCFVKTFGQIFKSARINMDCRNRLSGV
jgi:hypothetical protein